MSKRKTAGILLIILGIVCTLALVAYSLHHANEMWHLEMKAQNFDSFAAYYFTSAKGSLLVSGYIGLVFVLLGIRCLRSRR